MKAFKGTVSKELRGYLPITIYQLKALFNDYCRPSQNWYFIKGTLHNQQKNIQFTYSPKIPDCLDGSRCSSFHCVRVILDDAIICMDKNTRI